MELLVGRLIQTRGGLEADLRHTVGDMDPQEQGHLQGHLIQLSLRMPLRIQLRDFTFLGTEVALAPRTLFPCCDRPCCRATFINSMKFGGTVRGASLSLFKKKNNDEP